MLMIPQTPRATADSRAAEAFALVEDNKYAGACSDACLQRERAQCPEHEVDPNGNVSPTRRLESINAGGAFR
jgi:hypothetical protein